MLRSLDAVLDVMRVPASGDPSVAVVPCPAIERARSERVEILIVGGGTGGVAAALAAASAGRQVVLLEETDWLGGQLTAQGVSALDEHAHIETFGGTERTQRKRRGGPAVKLSRDPVCGTWVSPSNARFLQSGSTTHYFCSDECRRKFQSR